MSEPKAPLVQLAIPDADRRGEVEACLAAHPLGLRIAAAGTADEQLANLKLETPTLILLDHRLDEEHGIETLRRIRDQANPTPRVVLLFDDPRDDGRTLAAEQGVIDFVYSTGHGVDQPLMALVGRLITRDLLENRLDATTMQFRALVENSSDGIYILQKGDHIAYANPRFEEMVGFSYDELTGQGFSIFDNIVAKESLPILEERLRLVKAGLPVPPRYEFVARRKDNRTFDAQVSISYISFRGEPSSLGIMQDITERKQFEAQLVRKNRELALLNDLAASINEAVEINDILRIGCRRLHDLLRAGATGITLLTRDKQTLELKASEGLVGDLEQVLTRVSIDRPTLLAKAVRRGEVQIVTDLHADERVSFDEVKLQGFEGAVVVPVKARDRILGAAFVFTEQGRSPSEADKELMVSIGVLLGTAIEKASLLEQERASVDSLTALDEIALAVASRLDAAEIADTVARSVQRIYGPRRVMISRYEKEKGLFVPLCVLERGETVEGMPPLAKDETLLGEAADTRAVVVRSQDDDPEEKPLPVHTKRLFDIGIGAAVALPVVTDGEVTGGMLLGYEAHVPLDRIDLSALAALTPHVAVAFKNADLFEARNQALEDLRAAQDKLVQSEKLRALGELAAGVAHDFNNVLGAILGRTQLLKTQLYDPALRKHADIIEKAAVDGAETVRRIQEIGRQETTDDFVEVDLSEIVRDVIDITQPRWRDRPAEEGRPITLETDLPTNGVWCQGNPHELREVLINLVHNAVDAMPKGGQLTLSVARSEHGRRRTAEIRVRDSGTGMPDAVRERIFDPFFTTKGERGTGLGLSVSFSIVQRHGGEIDVLSTTSGPEHGTTFVLSFPEIEAPAPTNTRDTVELDVPPMLARPAEETMEDDGLPRILVIDDEENIRDILTDILETGGYEVLTASDGPEGLQMLTRMRFDLVFTDLGLPGMNGYEVAAKVKERFPRLPVGLVTGWGATLDHQKVREHGVDLVLSKPFKFEQVLDLVQEAMAAAQQAVTTPPTPAGPSGS